MYYSIIPRLSVTAWSLLCSSCQHQHDPVRLCHSGWPPWQGIQPSASMCLGSRCHMTCWPTLSPARQRQDLCMKLLAHTFVCFKILKYHCEPGNQKRSLRCGCWLIAASNLQHTVQTKSTRDETSKTLIEGHPGWSESCLNGKAR